MSSKSKELPLDFNAKPIVPTRGVPWAADKWMVRTLLRALNDAPIAIRLWSGETLYWGQSRPEVTLRIRDRRALWQLVFDPDLYFGDAYSTGRLVVEGDLLKFLDLVTRNLPQSNNWLPVLRSVISRTPRSNTLRGSRQNIHHHYDLSNEFYALWLDREYLQYTCAYFPTPTV
ncbi:MAG: class I SAM-dependent methyltransferase, partial [Gammaproteobacteria bacterium]|nr:class I SAM-dependent methyltransferase [Gammaproteobacteria bacterium]